MYAADVFDFLYWPRVFFDPELDALTLAVNCDPRECEGKETMSRIGSRVIEFSRARSYSIHTVYSPVTSGSIDADTVFCLDNHEPLNAFLLCSI